MEDVQVYPDITEETNNGSECFM